MLVPGGYFLLSHSDYDTLVFNAPDLELTRRLVHAFADTQEGWMDRADGTIGRKLRAIAKGAPLELVETLAWVELCTDLSEGSAAEAAVAGISGAVRRDRHDALVGQLEGWIDDMRALADRGELLFSVNDYAVLLRRAGCGVAFPPCRWSSPSASAASPSTRPPRATGSRARWPSWPPTSRPTRRCPRSSRPPPRRSPAPTATRTRPTRRCAAGSRTATRCPPGRIAIGNGSCDILLAAGEALLEPGAEVVYAWPSFSVYPHLAAASGARAIEVPLDADHRHDLDAMAAEVTAATRLLIVCNPNNPTSTALPLEQIAEFIAGVPRHVAVILDEAYIEFSVLQDPQDSVDLLAKHPNLALLRTFSKIYGLCGLRVGYALCGSEELRTAVDQVRQPFFCNVAAQAAAVEALDHQDEVARRVERNLAERIGLEEGLRELGIECADSQANFVWFDLGEGVEEPDVVQGLSQRGVLVRAGGALGRPGALRVTVGTQAENERFLEALAPLL